MQIYLDSVGCRLNWSEIETLARQLTAAGEAIVTRPEAADVIVLNTCAVTAQAERKTRHTIRSLHRDNPDAELAVIGCYATLRPDESAGFSGVSWVIPNVRKDSTAEIVARGSAPPPADVECFDCSHQREGAKMDAGSRIRLVREEPGGRGAEGSVDMLRTRAFVKVQDGCDHHCTYCIVRSLRGSSRSRPLDDVITELQTLIEGANCQEAVLTGASLGAYGRARRVDKPASQRVGGPGGPTSVGLRTLIETILAETDLARLRLSSLEPWDLDSTFFELWENPRLCRQIHLPLQAGCDATLRRMGRPITTDRFAALVEAAREAIPDLAVTTDVLVGFPGEDEAAFRESYAFVKRMRFAKLHVFPYSPRPGTPATRLPGSVPRDVRDERARQMRELGAEQRRRFQTRFLNRVLKVLWEKQWQDGRWTGWTDNYIRVVARAEGDERCTLVNRITKARLLTVENGYMKGEIVP